MAVKNPGTGATRVGSGTRLRILGLVFLNAVLALAVTVALIWLAGRPGLHRRIDLTEVGENTLDESLQSILDQLPKEIEIDVFFRPVDKPLQQLGGELQGRMFDILLLAEEYAPEQVKLTNHPYATPGRGGAELQAAMRRFDLKESNTVVVSSGDRRAFLRLLGDVAEIDIGNPFGRGNAYRPPSITAFRGQEALLKAILKATQGEKPLALFSKGHGEREVFADGDLGLGRLHSALVADGFRVETWDPAEDGAVPEDCAVLAIVGAEERFSSEELGWIAAYVRGGGSIIAAPGMELLGGQGSVPDLLTYFGIRMSPGWVARPFIGASGALTHGNEKCVEVLIGTDGMLARHPVTESLRRGDRRVVVYFGHALERGEPPAGGTLLDLLRTDDYSWEEIPDAQGEVHWMHDTERERSGPFTVAMASVFSPTEPGPLPPPGTNPLRPECRVLAVSSPVAFDSFLFDVNRDFLINAFNWAASREFRVSVSPRRKDDRRLDIGQDRSLFVLNLVAIWILPLACLALGAFTVWRRRR